MDFLNIAVWATPAFPDSIRHNRDTAITQWNADQAATWGFAFRTVPYDVDRLAQYDALFLNIALARQSHDDATIPTLAELKASRAENPNGPPLFVFLHHEHPDPTRDLAYHSTWYTQAAATLQRLRDLATGPSDGFTTVTHDAFSFQPWLERVAKSKGAEPLPDPLRTYLTGLQRDTTKIVVQGFRGKDADAGAIQLSDVFVDLSAQHRTPGREKDPTPELLGNLSERRIAVSALPSEGKHLVIIGDPGSGKTSLLRYLAGQTTTGLLSHALADTARQLWYQDTQAKAPLPVPFFVVCHEFGTYLQTSTTPTPSALRGYLEQISRLGSQVDGLFQEGRAVLLLDGLDELPTVAQRKAVFKALDTFLSAYPDDRFSVLITCRTRAFEHKLITAKRRCQFKTYHVNPMNRTQREQFLHSWFAAVARLNSHFPNAPNPDFANQVIREIEEHDHVREMAVNPNILTLLAVIRLNDKPMPHMRAQLYRDVFNLFLQNKDEDRDTLFLEDWQQTVLRDSVRDLAGECHTLSKKQGNPSRNQGCVLFTEATVIQILRTHWEQHRPQTPNPTATEDQALNHLLQCLELRVGILLRRDGDHPNETLLRFSHHGHQEYQAGLYLIHLIHQKELGEHPKQNRLNRFLRDYTTQDWWHEPLLLALTELGCTNPGRFKLWLDALLQHVGTDQAAWRNYGHGVALATAAVADLTGAGVPLPPEVSAASSRAAKALLYQTNAIPAKDRAEAVSALGAVHDPRLGMFRADRWVRIEPGEFIMGEKDGQENEQPPLPITIKKPYWIGKYPLTNQEFAAFVADGGYQNQQWWLAEPEGWDWLQSVAEGRFDAWFDEQVPADSFYKDHKEWLTPDTKPAFWETANQPPNMKRNHPVTGISFYEATAYCRWLQHQMLEGSRPPIFQTDKLVVRLPSEAQWEFVARGSEGRRFPWAAKQSDEPSPQHANFEGNHGDTTPVGLFPLGKTPAGVFDMSGNTWEWCVDIYDTFVTPGRRAITDETAYGKAVKGAPRVVRGGGWSFPSAGLRAACRFSYHPAFRSNFLGFRCVVWCGPEHDP
ncbi:SUMF1/EgtB/PvdO family nonheme iron enzyme [Acanthopleuribacter pedis]|uniref:SUMF1/EgtB/PvdO family nonheme iron enzyme n=1 Tax=Acanthopleuribacter pedis TaxID=442870 RepID=A0A8J7U1V9_9BACT|nr:SUMF1/EgtB/PvdO family nonheme iron enzyme [Acanthopleuribacter pedis]MBO1317084.1 SUMF1/EgtB/PvdO family nonheme iron enzyme [Acanthopleuribacter pedis]